MRPLAQSRSRIEAFYRISIHLYPRRFHAQYGDAMRQAFRDAMRDPVVPRSALLRTMLRDLVLSLAKEHLVMLRDTFTRPAMVFNALILAGISTVLALCLYAIPQQVLRLGADDPQLQLAGDAAARLEQGVDAAEVVPPAAVDMAHSLAPFLMVYDDLGKPIAAQGQLNGTAPAPPPGVFNSVRRRGEERVTWQPVLGRVNGVRIAAVVERVRHMKNGGSGFVLAGRSLAQVEAREEQVRQMAGLAWVAMLGLIFAGVLAFGWYVRPREAKAS